METTELGSVKHADYSRHCGDNCWSNSGYTCLGDDYWSTITMITRTEKSANVS